MPALEGVGELEVEKDIADSRENLTFKNPQTGGHEVSADGHEQGSEEMATTVENIASGRLPDWCLDSMLAQALDPRSSTDGGPARLLWIHPTDAARRQTLQWLTEQLDGPSDRTLHHTLDSLIASLHAELRLPRRLGNEGSFQMLLHVACEEAAEQLEFPLIHPLPDHEWGRGKTRDLAALNRTLREQDVPAFEGPGLSAFRRVIRRLADGLGGMHPDVQLHALVIALEALEADEPPFGLRPLDGVILLDHPPTLSPLRCRLLRALARFKPLHELCQPGSPRMGVHGLNLDEQVPLNSEGALPTWVPAHPPFDAVREQDEPVRSVRILLSRWQQAQLATRELVAAWLEDSEPTATAIIIDPGLCERAESWGRSFAELGVRCPTAVTALLDSPAVHWTAELATLATGEEAWSLDRLRGLAMQRTLMLSTDWLCPEQHPTEGDWRPIADIDVLEEVSRGFHLLGGPGALRRWLQALARRPIDSGYVPEHIQNRRHEQTQWWLLSIANRLRPLLRGDDRSALDEALLVTGCSSGEPLPLPAAAANGDAWLRDLLQNIDWSGWNEHLDGGRQASISGLQHLLQAHAGLRRSQRLIGQQPAVDGREWVFELLDLLAGLTFPASDGDDDRVRLLTPSDALGCSADLIILTHLDTGSWDLRPESIPGLADEERAELDILPPDARMRQARHCFHHLLHAASEVVVLDAPDDESGQPAAPLSEWLQKLPVVDEVMLPSFLGHGDVAGLEGDAESAWAVHELATSASTTSDYLIARPVAVIHRDEGRFEVAVTGGSARDRRQRDGIDLHAARAPASGALNPAALTVPLDEPLMRDRLRRQPLRGSDEQHFLSDSEKHRMVSIERLRLQPKATEDPSPREHASWPTIGLRLPNGRFALSVDPRPLAPSGTAITDNDHRHGFEAKATGTVRHWSASRLRSWLTCPRQAWLKVRLKASQLESLDEDIDNRTRGLLLHGAYAELLCDVLGITLGEERTSFTPHSLAVCGESEAELMQRLLSIVDEHAPWLRRGDGVAAARRLDLVGMNDSEWADWLANPVPIAPVGRFGDLLRAELSLAEASVLSLEWSLPRSENIPGVKLELPDKGKDVPAPILVRGNIDRVELFPHGGGSAITGEETVWVGEEGVEEVCPLDLDEKEEWNARRLVIIRDLKTLEGPNPGKGGLRHRRDLMEDVQLALYARAWEVCHPGDRVIGVGITEVGERSGHYLEVDPDFIDEVRLLGLGTVGSLVAQVYRQPSEKATSVTSNPFRSWIRHRITAALLASEQASAGLVHPTPRQSSCSYCDVKAICGLAASVGGERQWS